MTEPRPTAPGRRAQWLQLAIVALLIGGYTLVSQYGYSSADGRGVGAGLSVGPIVLIAIVLAWRWAHPVVASLVSVLLAVTLYLSWPFLKTHYQWSDLIQQVGAFAMLAIGVGRSLLPGRMPTCTELAKTLHGGELLPVELVYLRRASIAWFLVWTALAVSVLILFFAASEHIWSLYVNFGTFGLIGIVFLADHALRRRVLPRRPGASMLAALLHSLTGPGQR